MPDTKQAQATKTAETNPPISSAAAHSGLDALLLIMLAAVALAATYVLRSRRRKLQTKTSK